MKRRTFLLAVAGTAGGLVVGWTVLRGTRPYSPAALRGKSAHVTLNGWIEMSVDGIVHLAVPRCEMGQGVYTALAMLAADELDMAIEQIRILDAPMRQIFASLIQAESFLPELLEDQRVIARGRRWLKRVVGRQSLSLSTTTAGSTSLRELWLPVRTAGAQVKATLVNAAARLHAVDFQHCRTELGNVVLPDGRRVAYAEILKNAEDIALANDYKLKTAQQFTLIGQSPVRIDARAKCDGSAKFASDVRMPGMRYAALAMPPSIGARLLGFREPPDKRIRVVRVPAGYGQGESLAVIADSWWTAHQVASEIDVSWDESAGTAIDQDSLTATRHEALARNEGTVKSAIEDVDTPFGGSNRTIEAEYAVPYLAHAAMESMNCTAQVTGGVVRVWAPVQAPQVAIAAAARAAKVSVESVDMVVPMLGGGFGRRLEADFVFQAVSIAALAGGQPVQMLWTREQDFRHDFYRPATTARLRAAFDVNGRIIALDQKVASQSVGLAQDIRNETGKQRVVSAPAATGLPYAIPNQRYRLQQVDSQVPIGSWRSVDASYNGFFVESFIDELAAATKRDPVALRRELLGGQPRHIETLERAIAVSGYGPERVATLKQQGRGMGIALFESVGSVVAHVVEVSIEGDRPRVHRVTCAIHCGLAVHPGGIAQQVEGAVIMGIGAAIDDGIEIRKGRIVQGNFHQYQLPRMRDTPIIETHIVSSSAPPTGVGEAALPPTAPAIANAVFALTGQRLRVLPLRLV